MLILSELDDMSGELGEADGGQEVVPELLEQQGALLVAVALVGRLAGLAQAHLGRAD